jgi:hypothetical protein
VSLLYRGNTRLLELKKDVNTVVITGEIVSMKTRRVGIFKNVVTGFKTEAAKERP